MKHFDYITAVKGLLTPQTTTLLSAIHEAKGRQSVQAATRPDLLNTLITVARIQSTNASNRIEGISTSDKRLNALVAEKPRHAIVPRRKSPAIATYSPPSTKATTTFHRPQIQSSNCIAICSDTLASLSADISKTATMSSSSATPPENKSFVSRPQTHSSHRSSSSAPAPPIQKPSKTDISIHCSPQQCSPSTSPASTHSMTAMVE